MARTRPDSLADDDRERLREFRARLGDDLAVVAIRIAERIHASSKRVAEWMTEGLLGVEDRREIELSPHAMLVAIGVTREECDDRIASLYDADEGRRVMRSIGRMLDAELAALIRHTTGEGDRLAALQTLSAGLAHEVRNPLNAAKLQLELLERRSKRDGADPKHVEPLVIARQELERLTRLLGEFLAFARPTKLDLGDHDIVELARNVVAGEQLEATRHGATLQLEAPESIFARVDGVKVRQVVQNLVRNALEASARGRVVVSVAGDETTLHICVEDDGPGIPDSIRNRIFEPFFTTKPSGTGLGMSIVHSMVALHGGTIDVDTSPRGTWCDVALPRH